MKKVTVTSLLFFALFAVACSSSTESSDGSGEKATNNTAQKASVPDSPCDWINADDMRSLMNVGSEYEISMEAKDYTFPACSFRWEDNKVVKNMEVGGRQMSIDMPSEVLVVLVKDADAAKFQRSVKVYKDGEAVSGYGDEAMWGEQMHQLTFRKGNVMMHVNVKADNDDAVNKANAEKIAKFLLDKM